jgi:hypothetical protein
MTTRDNPTPQPTSAPREHVLKTWPNAYDAVLEGRKRFEWRRDDRGFEVGDVLVLWRWDPAVERSAGYQGNTKQRVRVTYILRGMFDIPHGFCVMSIEPERP